MRAAVEANLGYGVREIAAKTGLHHSTVRYHLTRLEAAGKAVGRKIGRKVVFSPPGKASPLLRALNANVATVLGVLDVPRRRREIVWRTGLSLGRVKAALALGVKYGLILRVSRGFYRKV